MQPRSCRLDPCLKTVFYEIISSVLFLAIKYLDMTVYRQSYRLWIVCNKWRCIKLFPILFKAPVFRINYYLRHDCGATGQLRRERSTSATRGMEPWRLLICGADVRFRLHPRLPLFAPHRCDAPCSAPINKELCSIYKRKSVLIQYILTRWWPS